MEQQLQQQLQQHNPNKSAVGCLITHLKNPKIAAFFLEFIKHLTENYDGIPINEIVSTTWGKDIKDLETIVKIDKKRVKKQTYKFIPTNMPTKKSPNILFITTYYKKFCIDNNIKFNLSNCSKAYNDYKKKCKDNNEPNEYEKQSNELKNNYKMEYIRQLTEAKQLGTFPEDKPKLPLSAYFRFLADKRKTLVNQEPPLTNIEILNAIAIMWKTFSIDEKLKYETEYIKDKEVYKLRLAEWSAKEALRINPNMNTSIDTTTDNTSDNTIIDTSGDKDKNDANVILLIKTDITNAINKDFKNNNNEDDTDDDETDDDNDVVIEPVVIEPIVIEPVVIEPVVIEPVVIDTVKPIAIKVKRAPAKKKVDTA